MMTPGAETNPIAHAIDPHPPREPRAASDPLPTSPHEMAEDTGRQDGLTGRKDDGLVDGNSAVSLSIAQEQSLYLSPAQSDGDAEDVASPGEGSQGLTEKGSKGLDLGREDQYSDSDPSPPETHTSDATTTTTISSQGSESAKENTVFTGLPSPTDSSNHSNLVPPTHRFHGLIPNPDILTANTHAQTSSTSSETYTTATDNDTHHDLQTPVPNNEQATSTTMPFAPFTSNPTFSHKRLYPLYPSSFLRPGSKFSGTQQSEQHIYNVDVEILTLSVPEASMTGYLRICGLTEDNPTLTTFFTGEIIGGPTHKHTFHTKDASWGANEKSDLHHWARFPAWRHLHRAAKENIDFKYPSPLTGLGTQRSAQEHHQQQQGGAETGASAAEREYDNPANPGWWTQPNVFMRWKEWFLVPDHRVRSILGASFEGFYYICFNQAEGKINGIYFHSKSEK